MNQNGQSPAGKLLRQIATRLILGAWILCTISVLPSRSYAQNSLILEAYIRTGLNTNLALQQQNFDLQKSQEAIRQAKALFNPTLKFEANYTLAAGGRSIDFPIGDLLTPLYQQSFGIPSPAGNQQIQFLPNNFQETKISFAYPLYNTDLRYNRQIQTALLESKTAQKAAYEQELRYQITTAYLQYLQTLEAEKIWANAKSVLLELRRFNESLVKNNVATRDVVATADYELSKTDNEIFKLKSAQNTARSYFNFLINKDLQDEVTIDTALLHTLAPAYPLNDVIQQSRENRAEFAALRAGLSANELDVKRNAANLKRPDLYVGGEFGFQGFGYRWFSNGGQAYALGQVGLTYDLFDAGLRKSKTQVARLETEKTRTQLTQVQQQITLQVTSAWNELDAARNTFLTSQSGLRAAEETFRIVNNKYRANQVLLLEFLDAQNRVTTARLQGLLAWSDVLIKEAALRQVAGL